MDIKAIETRYQGYRFRSRTEARWAIFFDAMGIEWEYEPEGFNLSDGGYLPDFVLPKYGDGISQPMFVEVKPVSGDFSRARRFAEETKQWMFLAEGPPDFRNYRYTDSENNGSISWDSGIPNIRDRELWMGLVYELDPGLMNKFREIWGLPNLHFTLRDCQRRYLCAARASERKFIDAVYASRAERFGR
jgi:hypothetical protein